LFPEVLCDAGLAPCPPGSHYPKPSGTVVLKPLPIGLPTMPNPCAGAPSNPWCPNGEPLRAGHHRPSAAPGVAIARRVVPLAARRHPAR